MPSIGVDPRIREVSASQVAEMIRLADETGLSPWSAQNYFDELQTDASVMLSLVDATAGLLGFIVGRMVPASEAGVHDAEIYNIAIVPSLQGRGLGQQLLNEFLARCGPDVQNVWLEVRGSNEKAITFYTRNGFEPVQTRRDFYQNPREDAIVMRLLLKKHTA